MDIIYFLIIRPQLSKVVYQHYLNIREVFFNVKMENGLLGEIQKTGNKNGHAFYTTTDSTI